MADLNQNNENGNAAPPDSSNQYWSVLLFAIGVLTGLLTLVKGSSGWNKLHNLLLGLFGLAVIAVPTMFIYVSIQIGRNRNEDVIRKRTSFGCALTIFLATVIQVFTPNYEIANKYFEAIKIAFADGKHLKGGGAAGSAIAWFLLKYVGALGARIITGLAVFVLVMCLTGNGMMDLFGVLKRFGLYIRRCGNGLQNMIMGGEFHDEFVEDDDSDDENLPVPSENTPPEQTEPRPLRRRRRPIRELEPLPEQPQEDNFDLDVALPDGEVLPPVDDDFEIFPMMNSEDTMQFAPPEEVIQTEQIPVIPEILPEPASEPENAAETVHDEPLQPQYVMPPLDLLSNSEVRVNKNEVMREMHEKADIIVNTLSSFGVEVKIKDAFRGPAITRYEAQPGVGVKVKKITSLADDIALSLAAQGVRIAPVPGKAVVGIEIPNSTKDTVSLREILSAPDFRNAGSKLTFAVGKDITGNVILGDVAKMPHVIIAGTTGSGKSVCTRSIIMSILFNARPDEVKLILIDPKIVEFKVFEGIPHLLIPIVTDVRKAAGALGWAVNEMMRRYNLFADAGANDLKSYNELARMDGDFDIMPQIVVFIDELADMMLIAKNEVEDSIQRLAQMGRAAGMHLVVATQRPTTDVITGIIKANIPSRIALSVKSQVDSRTIIDSAGAEKLLGNGDMLYMPIGASDAVRVQGCFASNKDINCTLDFIKNQFSEVTYDNEIVEAVESFVPAAKGDHGDSSDSGVIEGSDEDYVERAIRVAVDAGQLSTSMLQRKLKLGYARAARIMDELEERGVIAPSEGAKPRRVLMSRMQYDERRMRMEND